MTAAVRVDARSPAGRAAYIYDWVVDAACDPERARWVVWPLLMADAVLCGLVVWKVPYTEIDWRAYMEQAQLYIDGERDYLKIKGATGPLVYPAAHLYAHTVLYWITDRGKDIFMAQCVYGGLYLVTLAAVMSAYRQAKVPPYVFPLLILSKRLHSIFLLRCFNDCIAVLFLWLAINAYQRRLFTVGSLLYSWGVGTKMSLLLALPALGTNIFLVRGAYVGLQQLWMMVQLQLVLALPFLPVSGKGYLSRAFDFSRQFLYKWTVNWRFVGEEVFLSKAFSTTLLVGHVSLLALFVLTRWLQPAGRSIGEMVAKAYKIQEPLDGIQPQVARKISPRLILTTILTANVVGMLFARSLHYQFFAILAWSTPFLLWRTGLHPLLQYGLWAMQEWAWNVYPSTSASSAVVVGVMAVTIAGVWWNTGEEDLPDVPPEPTGRFYIK